MQESINGYSAIEIRDGHSVSRGICQKSRPAGPRWPDLPFTPSGTAEPCVCERIVTSQILLDFVDPQVPEQADEEVVVTVASDQREGGRAALHFEAADVLGDEAEVVGPADGAEDLSADDDAGDLREDGGDVLHANSGHLGVQGIPKAVATTGGSRDQITGDPIMAHDDRADLSVGVSRSPKGIKSREDLGKLDTPVDCQLANRQVGRRRSHALATGGDYDQIRGVADQAALDRGGPDVVRDANGSVLVEQARRGVGPRNDRAPDV